MTAALIDRGTSSASVPPCPAWCSNHELPMAAVVKDLCDAGPGGDRWHNGDISQVVLPSVVDDYYDRSIGVELFRYDSSDGSVLQLAVLLTYSSEMTEHGHVALNIPDARRLVERIRFGTGPDRFGEDGADIRVYVDEVVMDVEGRARHLELHKSQFRSLADAVASACRFAEVSG